MKFESILMFPYAGIIWFLYNMVYTKIQHFINNIVDKMIQIEGGNNLK